MEIKRKKTDLIQWELPHVDHPKYSKSLVPWFDAVKEIDKLVFEVLENGAFIVTGYETIVYTEAVIFPPASANISWTNLRVVSPASGGVLTLTGSPLNVQDGTCLYVEAKRPVETTSVALRAGDAKAARKKGNIPLGVILDDAVYMRRTLQNEIGPQIDDAKEIASLIVSVTALSDAEGSFPRTLTWSSIKVVSPFSGGIVTVTGSPLTVTTGKHLYITATLPLQTASLALQAGTATAAQAAGNIPLGYVDTTTTYFRPNVVAA